MVSPTLASKCFVIDKSGWLSERILKCNLKIDKMHIKNSAKKYKFKIEPASHILLIVGNPLVILFDSIACWLKWYRLLAFPSTDWAKQKDINKFWNSLFQKEVPVH